ncbi:MAG: diguanylate cyclase [Porticoccus sp.]|nr:diguanylate cyclase [Porticoccus sp.]
MNIFSTSRLFFLAFIGIALSVFLGWSFYEEETKIIELDIRRDTDEKVAALERELFINLEVLFSIKGLFDSSDNVTAAEFNKLTQSILARHPHIQALSWAPKVLHSERGTYKRLRRKELPDFVITERKEQGQMIRAEDREVYFPVYYIEPIIRNKLAVGFDLASNTERLKTLEISRDLGTAQATASITLVQEASNQKGFITFIPIYQGEPTTIEQRRDHLRGFVTGVFRIGDIFDSVIKHTSAQGITITLVDTSSPSFETLHLNHLPNEPNSGQRSKFSYQKHLTKFSGRQWSIIATPTNGYVTERRSLLPYLISLFGALFVALGAAYTFTVLRRSEYIETMVLDRTNDLNDAKQKLETLSRTDALTGIANRRCFDERLETEWKRAIREKTPLSLMMIDVDHFKQFNDRYGHTVGDNCLIGVASSLQKSLYRPDDLVARYGGEEFVIILPNTKDASTPAENCRRAIENLQISHETSDTAQHITISIGAVTLTPNNQSELIEFTNKADRALYEAKESGRNKVCT